MPMAPPSCLHATVSSISAFLFHLKIIKRMTFQTFNHRVLAIFLLMMASVSIHAQQPNPANTPTCSFSQADMLNNVAKLKRIEAMQPDSIQPKYQLALQSLSFAVTYPHAPQTEKMIAEAEQTITKMEQMKKANLSDICTLRGFLYMVRIVQDPAQYGQRYYIDVMENFEKALKLNPDNQLAKQLQQKFYEGMKQQTDNLK